MIHFSQVYHYTEKSLQCYKKIADSNYFEAIKHFMEEDFSTALKELEEFIGDESNGDIAIFGYYLRSLVYEELQDGEKITQDVRKFQELAHSYDGKLYDDFIIVYRFIFGTNLTKAKFKTMLSKKYLHRYD